MYLAPYTRVQFLECLPIKPKSIGAEIGVAEGLFSEMLLHYLKPKKLHLIDPWAEQKDNDYEVDINNVPQAQNNNRFESVSKIFESQSASGQVEIHRAYSQDMYDKFEDEYFDWIYIDGLHTYEGVRDDLNGFDKKIKKGGILMGHDYCNHEASQQMKFGVIPAVNEFVDKKGYTLLFLTHEPFSSYVIAKDQHSEMAQYLITQLKTRMNGMTWIDNPTKKFLKQDVMQLKDDVTGERISVKNFMYFMDMA